jgi:8-oxo-dGTP diphosphatase
LLTEQKTFLKNIEVQLPGGGVDPGEQLIPALHREVMEETGWHVCVNQKKGVFERFTYMPEYKIWAHKICHIYSCKAVYRKTSFLEKGHKYIVTDFNFAINRLSDPGFRYFVKKFEKSNF